MKAKLKKVSKELKGASRMHKKQAGIIDRMLKSLKTKK